MPPRGRKHDRSSAAMPGRLPASAQPLLAGLPVKFWLRFLDWPLRAKIAALLVAGSLLPLAIAALLDIREARQRLIANTAAVLAARGDQLVGELDAFNGGYLRSARGFAQLPPVLELCGSVAGDAGRLKSVVRGILRVEPEGDDSVRGAALLDAAGTVTVATEEALVGKNLTFHSYVRDALRGVAVISDIHLAEPEVGRTPTIAYLAPVLDARRKPLGFVALWVKATALWDIAKTSNALAGPGSFAVLFDHDGVRIAHTYSKGIVFHPGGELDRATLDALVAEQRFGVTTRALLEDVRPFPEQFARSRAESPDREVFRGLAPVNGLWNYGVARRFTTVPWTLFYMIPEKSLKSEIARMTQRKTALAGVIIAIALVVGGLFGTVIVRRVSSLSKATELLGTGDLSVRVAPSGSDEIGRLGTTFNAMASRIEEQDSNLRRARADLEERVKLRTAELQASEESLSITLHSIGDAVIATDAAGCVVRMNSIAEQLTGWSSSEAKGRHLAQVFCIINEDTRATVENPVDRVLREGIVVGLANHTALVSRSGSECAIADSGAPIRDAEGALRGVVLVFRDQTEERRVERALRESEARKTAIMEAALDSIVTMDHTGAIVEFNGAAEEMFGRTRAAVVGKSLAALLIPDAARERHSQGLARYLATGEGLIIGKRVEVSAVHADGREFPVEVAVVRIRTDGLPMFTGYIRDLTERKQAAAAERALERLRQERATAAQIGALLESAPDAMVIVDAGGKIVLVNALTESAFGYGREELLGEPVELLVPARFRAVPPAPQKHYFGDPKIRAVASGSELLGLRKDGSEFPIEISSSALTTDTGVLVSSAIRDITERKRTELSLRAANRELEAFSYSVAHDLRAPLRGMNGFAQILFDDYRAQFDSNGLDCINQIRQNAVRMGELIDALLSLARVTRYDLRPEQTDLSDIVRAVAAQFAAADSERRVEVDVVDGLWAHIEPTLGRTLVENLLGNAWKFTSKASSARIEFGVLEKDGGLVFFVRDNGAGFNMAHADKLFVPFQRLHAAREFPGTGIGLATAHRIVERHGGRIWAEGSVNHGATFFFTLPQSMKVNQP